MNRQRRALEEWNLEFTGKNTMEEVKGKGKRGLFRVIFGRTTFFLLFAFLQILILFWIYLWLDDQYRTYGYGLFSLVSAILAIRILNEKQNASFKMAWLIPVLIFPVFGALFYVFVQLQLETKIMAKRLSDINARTRSYLEQDEGVVKRLEKKNVANANLCRFLYERGGFPTYEKTHFCYFPLGDDFFAELLPELKKAQRFIFLEYFIIAEGIMWNSVLDILKDKVKEGLDVRLIYDDAGCITTLPPRYFETLRRYGIKAKLFNPIEPHLALQMNNRDHRKIVVIDGEVAFTGGVNLADEYINRYERFGHWKDMAVMIKGEAVQTFTVSFLQFWNFDEEEKSDPMNFIADVPKQYGDSGYVIPFCDSPTDEDYVGQQTHINMINSACRCLYSSKPYLVIDQETKMALILAAKNGVDVRILVPHIPDKKTVFEVTRSNYERLIESGVRIYEYTPGFVHGKVMLADDQSAVVGTVNMDYRSYYLHYECGVWMYRTSCLKDIRRDFEETFAVSHEVTLEECRDISIIRRFIRAFLNIVSPVM